VIDIPLLLSSSVPSGSGIDDLAVVDVDGAVLVVCVADSTVWTWNPARDEWRKRPLAFAHAGDPVFAEYPDADNEIDSVAAAVADGRIVLAAGADEQEPAFWDLDSGQLLHAVPSCGAYLAGVAAVEGPGPVRFVTSTQNADEVQVWQMPFDEPPVLLEDYWALPNLATTWVYGHLLVAGAAQEEVVVWDLARPGQHLGLESTGDDPGTVSWSRLDDRPIVVGGSSAGELWVWALSAEELRRPLDDLEEVEPLYDPIVGHEGRIVALDTITVGGRSLAVTGSQDTTVRVWDLAERVMVGGPVVGGRQVANNRSRVISVVTAMLQGRPVVLSSCRLDSMIRVWDLATLL
jgi:WD40 repeat protein